MMKPLFPLLIGALLAGCATMTPEERAQACQATDWQRFGENDGRLGVPTSERADDFQDCADAGAPADLVAYQAGRRAGLVEYCTAENGYRVGYEGRRYRKVCPTDSEQDFLQGLAQGRKERPVTVRPSFGIGIGSGGGVGVGIGIGLFNGFGHDRNCRWRPYGRGCW